VVEEALRRLDSPAPTETIMVGDRLHDVVGSGRHGISCLGAGWGYAEPGELDTAGALAVYPTAADLQAALL
jgi:phosphoglycolate phosphatase